MARTSKPTIAGVIDIIGGVLGFLLGLFIIFVGFFGVWVEHGGIALYEDKRYIQV